MAWQKYSTVPPESRILPARSNGATWCSGWFKMQDVMYDNSIVMLSLCGTDVCWHQEEKKSKLTWQWPHGAKEVILYRRVSCVWDRAPKNDPCPCPWETDSDFEHILKINVLHKRKWEKNTKSHHLASLAWMSMPCLVWQMNGANYAATHWEYVF